MIAQSNNKTRKKFLKKFTKELILSRKKQIEQEEKKRREAARLKKAIEVEKLKMKYPKPEPKPTKKPAKKPAEMPAQIPAKPTQPKPIIMPLPMRAIQTHPAIPINIPLPEMNIGKITALIKDPAVTSIECQGPNKAIIIKRNGQLMMTDIKLTKDEIESIIKEFSEKARIPLIEGLLRARVGNLQISAVISKVSASRFIITKIYLSGIPPLQLQQLGQLQKPQLPQLNKPPVPAMPIMPPINRPFVMQPVRLAQQQQQTQQQPQIQQNPSQPQTQQPKQQQKPIG